MVKPKALVRSCSEKARYPDEAGALRFAVTRPGRKSGDTGMRAYPCRICKGWHLSSKVLDAIVAAAPGMTRRGLEAAVKSITAPTSAKRKTSTLPTRKAGSSKLAGKRPTGGQSKRRRATVL